MVADLRASRELAWRLLVRNISAQYRQTLLGYVWAFLPPIVTTLVWVFLNAQKIFDVGETGVPYPVYVLTGTILWQVFVDAMNSPLRQVDGESKAGRVPELWDGQAANRIVKVLELWKGRMETTQ